MPELAELPTREEEKESMPTMGFLDHLEELRKRIIYSIICRRGGLLRLLVEGGAHLRHHAAPHHGCAQSQRHG